MLLAAGEGPPPHRALIDRRWRGSAGQDVPIMAARSLSRQEALDGFLDFSRTLTVFMEFTPDRVGNPCLT